MLNRKKAPPIYDINGIKLPPYQRIVLAGGIPLYVINLGTQDVFKLEVVFEAGRFNEEKQMVASVTDRLLKEGSSRHSAAQIAEMIDYYGGSLSSPSSLEHCSLVLHGMTKHFNQLLPIMSEILAQPTFPERELETYIKEKQQELQANLTKNDILAYRIITEAIYGKNHPYGYNSTAEGFAKIKRTDLVKHYENHFIQENCSIYLSGKVDEQLVRAIELNLIPAIRKGVSKQKKNRVQPSTEQYIFKENPESHQSAIRIGCRLFNKHHRDFAPMYVLNTLLGGYFGSRLMGNIREDKGYTYNIYSTLDLNKLDGAFIIGTEVGNEFTEQTMVEIFRELERLCNEPVGDDELFMLRNYLKGTFLNWLDGPFNVSDFIKNAVLDDLNPSDHLQQMVDAVEQTSAKQMQRLANKYFKKQALSQVIVGKKNIFVKNENN